MRSSSLMGRAFALRDRGRLEEALTVCQQAIDIAGPTAEGGGPASLSTIVMGAFTIDEIASRVGQPHLAREPLANALRMLQQFNRQHPAKDDDGRLRGYQEKVRTRLNEIRHLTSKS